MTVTGVRAELRWVYHVAGTLGAWTVSQDEDKALRLTAQVVNVDADRVAQRPLAFVVSHAKGVWRWPVTELQIADGALAARLGPLE